MLNLAWLFRRIRLILVLLLLSLASGHSNGGSPENALDDYINTPDFYSSAVYQIIPGDGYKLYILLMHSQNWRSLDEVDRILWTHWMAVIVPDSLLTDAGMLIIAGGNNSPQPDPTDETVLIGIDIAKTSGSVISIVGQIPNQPLYFTDEPFSHREDELIAYTYDKALDTADWIWPAYLPMAKASVRAMDAIQSLTADPGVSPTTVSEFVLTGFSKRGGTSWLTAAVDPRVRAIAPGVYDVLNFDEQMEHHYAAYGAYSAALDNYVNYNVIRRLRTPEGQALLQIVDPVSYKQRLTMPKFLLNSSGDRFFASDSARFYFDELPGENLIRYVANTDHDLETAPDDITDAVTSILSWYLSIIYEVPRPQLNWFHQDGQLIVQTDQPVLAARMWQANNPDARDFRKASIGPSWHFQPLAPSSAGTYSVAVPTGHSGWTAYFIDLIYPGVGGIPQTYSTPIFITPDTLPFVVSDPLVDPRSIGFWKHQINVAQDGVTTAQIPESLLASYFPVPLFDQIITDIGHAARLYAEKNNEARARARKHCLALRLNVRDGQLGWYTTVTLDDVPKKLWEYYTQAHAAYLNGDALNASSICSRINEF